MTYGQKLVSWNPKKYMRQDVESVKRAYAAIIDLMDAKREESQNPEVKRFCSVAITEAQTASMWAVKSLTWEDTSE